MKKMIQAGALALALILLSVLGYVYRDYPARAAESAEAGEEEEAEGSTEGSAAGSAEEEPEEEETVPVTLISPQEEEVVDLVTEPVKAYVDQMRTDFSGTDIEAYTKEDVEETVMKSVVFRWESEADPCTLELSTQPDFSDRLLWQTGSNTISVGYLQAGQTYYWRVTDADGSASGTRIFYTTDYPVLLSVDGITNVRDIGGYKTADGKTVKLGMIYRGSEMNQEYEITDAGIDTMTQTLHIKTDLDLRRVRQTGSKKKPLDESPLGEDVTYLNLPVLSYNGMMREENDHDIPVQENLSYIFSELLTDADNYPIYIHCQHGADRTGSLCFLIEGMLGVSYEDMILDYELTNFSGFDRGRNSEDEHVQWFNEFQESLQEYGDEGDSWETLCTNYLKKFVGVKQKDLDKINEILKD